MFLLIKNQFFKFNFIIHYTLPYRYLKKNIFLKITDNSARIVNSSIKSAHSFKLNMNNGNNS